MSAVHQRRLIIYHGRPKEVNHLFYFNSKGELLLCSFLYKHKMKTKQHGQGGVFQ